MFTKIPQFVEYKPALGMYLLLQCALHMAISVISTEIRRKDPFHFTAVGPQVDCVEH